MNNADIKDEFKRLHDLYKKNYGSQKAFKSVRHQKTDDGVTPVYYIGVPGMGVALAMTAVAVMTVALLYTPFRWYVWLPYLIAVFFIFRFSMKFDKVRQIRYMASSMIIAGMSLIEQGNAAEEHDVKKEKFDKAKEMLEKASEWVEEPALAEEVAELERILL